MNSFVNIRAIGVALLAFALAVPAVAADKEISLPPGYTPSETAVRLDIPAAPARMAPELALHQYELRMARQNAELGETDDTTTITADLPGAARQGQYTLQRIYSAPKSLVFKTLGFVGDGFVKSNVIFRLLQSEADHVKKDQPSKTAITEANYKFKYKGTDTVDGHLVHVFQVKPRHKRAGLFKGKVYIDVYTAAMVRAEGRLVKSPSLFIKKIEFVQDYTEVDGFNLISHIHSIAQTRIIGKAIVDISHNDYRVRTVQQLQAQNRGPSTPGERVSYSGGQR